MPIYLANPMESLTIKRITGTDKVKSHLENLGFVVGEPVMLVSKVNDNVIVKIKGVSLGIDRELAKRILV